MKLIHTITELREYLATARKAGKSIGLAPTMGALHAGHLSLVDALAAKIPENSEIVVSIFVNPLQFNDPKDFERYPNTLQSDLDALAGTAATVVFAPSPEEIYPEGELTVLITSTGPVAFEGLHRPGHFAGMLTVVAKLFNIVQPDYVAFGQKDAQQLFLVRSMVRDLNIPLEIVVVPTMREADGLAMSSRNRFLDPENRADALALSAALQVAAKEDGVDAALAVATGILDKAGVALDYFALVDPDTFQEVSGDYHGKVLAIVAANVGPVRLIDNLLFELTTDD
ncbi:MAG: pantoate--beta-alanine ligase [Microbacteriaceae bacterium]|nr:pantoate--beta-alanine ligase [Microbacteriaceae bacterium]